MQQTTNIALELYEATDNANLLDGYNSSMRKIDAHEGTQDGLITLAQSTANSAMSAATAADDNADEAKTEADAAVATANAADAKATTAGTNATQALTQLGGSHFYHIKNEDMGTAWLRGSWPTRAIGFNAFIIDDDNNGHGLMYGYVTGSANTDTTVATFQDLQLLSLTDWVADTAEGTASYAAGCWVSGVFAEGETILHMDGANLLMRPIVLPSSGSTIGAQHAFSASFCFPVVRRS